MPASRPRALVPAATLCLGAALALGACGPADGTRSDADGAPTDANTAAHDASHPSADAAPPGTDVVSPPTDASDLDASDLDANAPDASAPDAARSDARMRDSGAPDATAPDASGADTGAPDAVSSACAHNPWPTLEACGWPGPSNTGVPAGTALTVIHGDYVVSTDNAVLENKEIDGRLAIRARNVTVRNVFVNVVDANGVNGDGSYGIGIDPGASATIDHVRIYGTNPAHTLGTGQCIWHEGTQLTVTNSDISGCTDGIFSWKQTPGTGNGDHFTLQHNYLHDLNNMVNQDGSPNSGHIDGYQTEAAQHGLIQHNTFAIGDGNSAIAIWNSRGDSSDIAVDDNLIAGGGAAVYAEDYDPSETSPSGGYSVTAVTFTNNSFSTHYFPCVGNWFVWYARPAYLYGGGPTDGWHRTGNRVIETGESVDTGNPHVGGTLCN